MTRSIIRGVVLLFSLQVIGGLILSTSQSIELGTLLLVIILLTIIGFFIIGCIESVNRFQHLRNIAIVFWIGNLPVNLLLLRDQPQAAVLGWLGSIITISIYALIGGGLSSLFIRGTTNSSSASMNLAFQGWFSGILTSIISGIIVGICLEVIGVN